MSSVDTVYPIELELGDVVRARNVEENSWWLLPDGVQFRVCVRVEKKATLVIYSWCKTKFKILSVFLKSNVFS